MAKTTLTEDEWLAEIAALVDEPHREEGEVDKHQWAAYTGKTVPAAAYQLECLQRDGKLTSRKVFEAGKWVRVWRKTA